jgi:hypothetical protein
MLLFNDKALNRLVSAIQQHHAPSQRPVHSCSSLERILSSAVRDRTLNRGTLPVVLQRLTLCGSWEKAMEVLQHPVLDKSRVQRDDGIWLMFEKNLPSEDSKQCARHVLRSVFQTTHMHTLRAGANSGTASKDASRPRN